MHINKYMNIQMVCSKADKSAMGAINRPLRWHRFARLAGREWLPTQGPDQSGPYMAVCLMGREGLFPCDLAAYDQRLDGIGAFVGEDCFNVGVVAGDVVIQ
jgi:roadblock/LC7 domain-containing protein